MRGSDYDQATQGGGLMPDRTRGPVTYTPLRDVLARLDGDTATIWQGYDYKILDWADKHGFANKHPGHTCFPGLCPVHTIPFVRDDARRIWVCPDAGCGWWMGDASELSPAAQALWSAEQHTRRQMLPPGHGSSSNSRRNKKPRPRRPGPPVEYEQT